MDKYPSTRYFSSDLLTQSNAQTKISQVLNKKIHLSWVLSCQCVYELLWFEDNNFHFIIIGILSNFSQCTKIASKQQFQRD